MSNIHVVDPVISEAGCGSLTILFGIEHKREEFLDGRHGNVSAIVSRDEDLALEVKDENGGNCRCHVALVVCGAAVQA